MKKILFLSLLIMQNASLLADTIPDDQLKIGVHYADADALPGYHYYIEYQHSLTNKFNLALSINRIHSWAYDPYLEELGLIQEIPHSLKGTGFDLFLYYNFLKNSSHQIRVGSGLSIQKYSSVLARPPVSTSSRQITYENIIMDITTLGLSVEYEYAITSKWAIALRGYFNNGYNNAAFTIGLNLGYKF